MKKCAYFREQLSAYLDGALTVEEKRLVEEHLPLCEHCSLALTELKQTRETLRNLEEVEPPPWFTQKIMNRIREGAEPKKTFLWRLFHPLRIKIPMEAFATCLVVVLAFFIYKNTGPEMKAVHEPEETAAVSPQVQVEKDNGETALLPKGKESRPGSLLRKTGPEEQKTIQTPALLQGTGAEGSIKDTLRPAAVPAPKAQAARKDLEETGNRYETQGGLLKQAPSQEQKPAPAPVKKPAAAAFANKSKEESAPVPAGPLAADTQGPATFRSSSLSAKAVSAGEKRRFLFTVSAKSLETTAGEIEGLLMRFGAENTSRTSRQSVSTTLNADVSGQKVKEFFNELKKLGPVKEKEMPDSDQEERVHVVIEITVNP